MLNTQDNNDKLLNIPYDIVYTPYKDSLNTIHTYDEYLYSNINNEDIQLLSVLKLLSKLLSPIYTLKDEMLNKEEAL